MSDDERGPAWEDMGYGALPPDDELARHRRKREARHAKGPEYQPPKVVTQAKCQAHVAGCRALVDVTDETLGMIEKFDRILVARGEQPLDLNSLLPCDDCRRKRVEAATAQSAKRRARTTEAIRYLKSIPLDDVNQAHALIGGPVPLRTSETVVKATERMEWLGKVQSTGYVADLVNALREKARSGGKSRPRKEDL